MWCTRWFLPLLLLPLPTAPPFFLLLFVFSLTLHAKPCFYCIVLLTTLFVTSCYWQPLPLDSPLSTPWSENITSFAEALNASLGTNVSQPLPTVIRTVDRCWCDFSGGSFFESFNITHWEYLSVMRLKNELEHTHQAVNTTVSTQTEEHSSTTTPSASSRSSRGWSLFKKWVFHRNQKWEEKGDLVEEQVTPEVETSSWLRKEYDLRRYGLDVVLDFSW
jgi:hypothetical protein